MQLFKRTEKLMGCTFTLGIKHQNEPFALQQLQAGVDEIKRLENLLSEFIPTSDVSLINKNASHEPIVVAPETFALLERCEAISNLTLGDFDITTKALKSIYSFKNQDFKFPEKRILEEAFQCVGYQYLTLNSAERTLRINKNGVQISFAAIGKGFASDMVKRLWIKGGISSAFIDASGDLNAFGTNIDDKPFSVGIAKPEKPDQALLNIPISNAAVATSGDYEQHFTFKGKRYSHNINPKTGLPISGIKSVTVIAPSAELADALATAVYVKGIKSGLSFVAQLPQTHAVIIDDRNQIHFSKNINYEAVAV